MVSVTLCSSNDFVKDKVDMKEGNVYWAVHHCNS